MKQLVLDHYRRWALVLIACALLEFALGWYIATNPPIFEFWVLATALWSGPTLLSFDTKRGAFRLLATLPLTGRQTGRALWLATVPIPSIVLAALLVAGAATSCHFTPERPFPTKTLVMAGLFTFVWQGMNFAMTFNQTRGFGKDRREFTFRAVSSWCMLLTFFGSMAFSNGAAKDPFRSALILGFSAYFTIVGWRRAEQFEFTWAGLLPGRIEPLNLSVGQQLTPLERRPPPELLRAPTGKGGLPFLLKTASLPNFVAGLACATMIILIFQCLGQPESGIRMAVLMSSVIIAYSHYMPSQNLRFLRTLPISTARLAATLLALVVLPLLALATVLSAVANGFWGPSASLMVIQTEALFLIGAVLCVFIAIRLGNEKQGYLAIMITLAIFVSAGMMKSIPLGWVAPMALASILVAFVLVSHALSHSSRPYRMKSPLA